MKYFISLWVFFSSGLVLATEPDNALALHASANPNSLSYCSDEILCHIISYIDFNSKDIKALASTDHALNRIIKDEQQRFFERFTNSLKKAEEIRTNLQTLHLKFKHFIPDLHKNTKHFPQSSIFYSHKYKSFWKNIFPIILDTMNLFEGIKISSNFTLMEKFLLNIDRYSYNTDADIKKFMGGSLITFSNKQSFCNDYFCNEIPVLSNITRPCFEASNPFTFPSHINFRGYAKIKEIIKRGSNILENFSQFEQKENFKEILDSMISVNRIDHHRTN